MDEEAGFLKRLAAEPWDETCRVIYADWLDEQGRPEEAEKQRKSAPGYRALHVQKITPVLGGRHFGDPGFCSARAAEFHRSGLTSSERATYEEARAAALPDDWWVALDVLLGDKNSVPRGFWCCQKKTEDIVALAALAFSHLPVDRQRELLESGVLA